MSSTDGLYAWEHLFGAKNQLKALNNYQLRNCLNYNWDWSFQTCTP